MTVETGASFINQLNETYPRKSDLIKEGDDHIRLIKGVIKTTLPNFDRAVTMSASTVNLLNSTFTPTLDTLTINTGISGVANKNYNFAGNRLQNVANPISSQDVVTLNYLNSGGGAQVSWPVGSIYLSVDTRNPSAIFGFGTWVQFASGRCIIGSGTTIDENGEPRSFNLNQQGGSFQHRLLAAEMPSHTHGHNLTGTTSVSGSHSHKLQLDAGDSGYGRAEQANVGLRGYADTELAGEHSHNVILSGGISATGSNGSHNNIQPFITVNIWRRTE